MLHDNALYKFNIDIDIDIELPEPGVRGGRHFRNQSYQASFWTFKPAATHWWQHFHSISYAAAGTVVKEMTLVVVCWDYRTSNWFRSSSSCMIIASYGDILRVGAVVYAPSIVSAIGRLSIVRLHTNDLVQPDRSSAGHMYIGKYMPHVPVRHNDHTPQWQTSHLSAQRVSAKLHYTNTGYGHAVQHHQRTSSQQVVDVVEHVRSRLNLLYNILLSLCKYVHIPYNLWCEWFTTCP